MRASLRTLPPPDPFSRQPAPTVISLGQVRSRPRTSNEYVESPRAQPFPLKAQQITTLVAGGVGGGSPGFTHRVVSPTSRGSNCVVGGSGGGSPRSNLTTTTSLTTSSPVISLQPLSKSSPLKKESVNLLDGTGEGQRAGDATGQTRSATNNGGGPGSSSTTTHGVADGIMCERCGKCTCSACTEPRPLPSHWCCGDKCEVSPDKLLDVCTCFCCVKCTFYHCGTEEDENECYEHPCGCTETPHCCQRWTVISLMAMCLPCLWTYWPARGCLACCHHCYNCGRLSKGCQCLNKQPKNCSVLSSGGGGGVGNVGTTNVNVGGGVNSAGGGNSKHSQTRRLLIESDSSSA